MDGNQKPQTTSTNAPGQYEPVNNPSSLVEPSQPTLPAPVVSVNIPHSSPEPVSQPPQPHPLESIVPSEVISTPAAANNAPQPSQAVPSPLPPASPSIAAATPEESATPDGGFYHNSDAGLAPALEAAANYPAPAAQQVSDEAVVSWVSSGEAIQSRSQSWKVKMTLISVAAGAIIYLVTRDWVSSGSVALAGALFGILGSRKPHPLQYQVSRDGIIVGQRSFSYAEFRAFSTVDDGTDVTINLMPLKRFSPILSVHTDPGLRDQIVAVLANHLPVEAHRRDAIDAILSKTRL